MTTFNLDSMSETELKNSTSSSHQPQQQHQAKVKQNEEVEPWPKMFSVSSPSPTRCMIKEANEHLQLLHQRVLELERTVQEQSDTLIKKDETMQICIREVIEVKDAKITEMDIQLQTHQQRILELEQTLQEKDAQIERLGQLNANINELESYVPMLEKLLSSLKRAPQPYRGPPQSHISSHHHHHHHQQQQRHNPLITTTTNNVNNAIDYIGKTKKHSTIKSSNVKTERYNSIDRHSHHYHSLTTGQTQMIDTESVILDSTNEQQQRPSMSSAGSVSELRIGRSFNINSNFSMSEDEDDDIDNKFH